MRILIAGDYAPLERVSLQVESGGFDQIFPTELVNIIKSADFSIVNFESPVIERSFHPIPKCGPHLGCHEKSVEAVKYAGFKAVAMANNHILDYGVEGLHKTIDVCSRLGLEVVGVGNSLEKAQKILYVPIKDKVLAVINCCEHEFSVATDEQPGANPLNPIFIYYSIKEARKKANFVLVIVHGGHEEYQLPSTRMQDTYRFFIDSGADAVVNHHQHCYSGFEFYNEKPIFYGLGNFCFDEIPLKTDSSWNYGFMLELILEDTIQYKIYPYNQYSKDATIKLLPADAFDSRLQELNVIINNRNKLKQEVDNYYERTAPFECSLVEPYRGRILNKLFNLGLLPSMIRGNKLTSILNHLNCESHRDKMLFALKSKLQVRK